MKYSLLKITLVLFAIASLSCKNSSGGSADEKKILEFRGADISYLPELEAADARFYKNGTQVPLLTILKESGVNWIRLRLWTSDEDLQKKIALAKRIKAAGFNFLLDLHYSDTWADPSHQAIPADWGSFTEIAPLCNKVYDYTTEVLEAFKTEGCSPDMIQTGNEITGGMLFDLGKIESGNFTNLASLLKSASQAVRTATPNAKIMLHIECSCDKEASTWWFGEALNNNLDFDVIGLSYYAFYHSTDLSVLADTISTLTAQTGKPVCIVETNYPWTTGWKEGDNKQNYVGDGSSLIKGLPATPKGQKKYLKTLCQRVASSGGCGVFWWEPDAVAIPGFESDMENLTWFDFSNNYNGSGDIFLEFQEINGF